MTNRNLVEVYLENSPHILQTQRFDDDFFAQVSRKFESKHQDIINTGTALGLQLLDNIFPAQNKINGMRGLQSQQHTSFSRARNYWTQMQLSGYSIEPWKGRVLDFGCGVGGSSVFLGHLGAQVLAIDKQQQGIKMLEEVLKHENIDVSPLIADGLLFMQGLNDNSYDLVTGFMLGWYNTNKEFIQTFYEQAKRIVRPGGQIFVSSDLLTTHKILGTFKNPLMLKYSPLAVLEEIKK